MAIAHDSTSTKDGQLSASYTYSHTCSGSQRHLLVAVGLKNDTQTVTGITYNSIAMTKVAGLASTNGTLVMYSLSNPASGANNVEVTLSGAIESLSTADSYTGVDQYEPILSKSNSTGNGTDLSTSLNNLRANAMIDDCAYVLGNTSGTVGEGQTEVADFIEGNFTLLGSYKLSTTVGSYDMTWTAADSNHWHQCAVALRPHTDVSTSTGTVTGSSVASTARKEKKYIFITESNG